MILLAAMAVALPLRAQMVPGMQVVGQANALGLDRLSKSKDFTIQEIGCSAPANVLWPGDKASFRFRVTNLTAAPLASQGAIKIARYETTGTPGEVWVTVCHPVADVGSVPFNVNLAPHASSEIVVEPIIPETLGGYVFVAELNGHGRAFAASAVRSLRPDDGPVQYPGCSLDISLGGNSQVVGSFFKRLGVKAARMEMGAFPLDDKNAAKKWDSLTETMKVLKANDIAIMLTLESGDLPGPLGRPRPHLEADGTFKQTKSDYASLPSTDGEFENFVQKVAGEFGWPKGPVNAFELWNEPWEGISISGWGADGIRYRELYTAMAKGIEKARAETGAQVLIGGCGSSSNTIDKLFGDGSDTFMKWLDFCSIHYQAMAATPALMRDFVNRKSPNGPVRVWDTESWVANSEDRIGLVVATMHAMGQDRAMGVYAGNIYQTQDVTVDGKKDTVVQAWSGAAAMAASAKFVGQRKFHELLFQNGLPWVFVFDGPQGGSPDDGTVVVAGDLSDCYDRNLLLFRTVYGLKNGQAARDLKKQMAALPASAPDATRKALQVQLDKASVLQEGSLTISNDGGRLVLIDFDGNPVPAKNGKIIVPLNGYGYYLRTNGAKGSFAKLLEELRHARIEGYEPVEIVAHDFTAPVSANPAVHLTVTNVLNRPVSGKLNARIGNGESTSLEVKLAPNETRQINAPIAGLQAAADNSYPLHVTFDAEKDGNVVHDETLHCNVIAKRTISVDGKLDDWKGVLPQPLASAGIGASLTEKAWLPFNTFDDSVAPGTATGYAAYDNDNFYFAARIADNTPEPGMVRFETRDDDQYFYPDVSKWIDPAATFAKVDRVVTNPNFQSEPLQMPEGSGRSSTVWESVSKALAFDLSLPAAEPHQVALYLLSWNDLGRHSVTVEISDPATGKMLDKRQVTGFGEGKYAIYNLSGNVRVKVTSNNWLKGVLSGVFFDKAAPGAKPANGASAQFVAMDDKTHGNWKGVYGAEGYEIAGGPQKSPASYGRLAFATEIKKEELTWPAGVRHFSYRKNPDLPAGDNVAHDNVQIAFNVLPDDQKPWLPSPPGTPAHWETYWDTDYEYALNPVAAEYGGGTEIWRLLTPGMPAKHFYPREPKSKYDGPVKNGKLVIRREGNTRIVEASLPWSEIPEVKKRLDAGQTIKFDFRVNDNASTSHELATDRSVSKVNNSAFHNAFQTHWANELEFGFEK